MSLTIHLASRTEVGMMQKCVPILLLCYKEVDLFLIFDKNDHGFTGPCSRKHFTWCVQFNDSSLQRILSTETWSSIHAESSTGLLYSVQRKLWVPLINNKQRNNIDMYKRFTV